MCKNYNYIIQKYYIMELNLRKFNMRKIKKGSIIVMIGKRNTGKSFLMKDYLYYNQDFPTGMIISPTEEGKTNFGHYFPKMFIHYEYTKELIKKFVKRQKMITKKDEKEKLINGGRSNIDPNSILVFDDCAYDDSWTKDKNMKFIFLNGRHRHITFIFSLQDPLIIKPVMRNNTDYVFILRDPSKNNRKRIYEHYCSILPTYDIFSKIMDNCTENYECLVLDRTVQSNKIEDQLFWYKADSHDKFKVGSQVYWDYSAKHCKDNESEDENELVDLNDYTKRNSIPLKINKSN